MQHYILIFIGIGVLLLPGIIFDTIKVIELIKEKPFNTNINIIEAIKEKLSKKPFNITIREETIKKAWDLLSANEEVSSIVEESREKEARERDMYLIYEEQLDRWRLDTHNEYLKKRDFVFTLKNNKIQCIHTKTGLDVDLYEQCKRLILKAKSLNTL